MKKLIAIVLTISMLLSLLLTGCSNEPVEPDPYADIPETSADMFEYEENEDGGITIVRYVGTDEIVNIPAHINSKDVIQIGYAAFIKNTSLSFVKVPSTVTSICSQAFEECESLEIVILSENLTIIEKFAFRNCKSLKEISIPDSVTEIGQEAFIYSGLESIEFGKGLTQISESVFHGTCIKSIEIPANIHTLSFGAFNCCSQLETVVLHDGLQTIGAYVFGGESKLQEIVIPKTVTTVEDSAFNGCNSLRSIKFDGDAPEAFGVTTKSNLTDIQFIVYYHEDAKGFDSSQWEGYPTEIW